MIDRFRGEFGFLSNFALSPIEVEGIRFTTVEHAYQAAKFPLDFTNRRAMQENMARQPTAAAAKRFGRSLEALRDDWNAVRVPIMWRLLRLKFEDGGKLATLLAETDPHELVEGNDWGDTFWGVCRGRGQNMLGKLLMDRRDIIVGRCVEP